MKKRRILTFLLIAALLLRPALARADDAPLREGDDWVEAVSALGLDAEGALIPERALEPDGRSVLVYERRSGAMIYGKGVDERRYPASLTKLMTCLLALEYGDPGAWVTVTERALSSMDSSGSSADLRAGEVYTLEQLLYCLMVKSANDAALVIAEYIGGSQADFVDLMNRRAEELGCTGTHFVNPHGMHDEEHYSTARDLARIAQADLEYDLFRSLYSAPSYTLPATEEREARTLYSTNYLISTDIDGDYYDPRVAGGKTGFTTPAGRCVVCTSVDDLGCAYLIVVLGASATDGNGKVVYSGFTTASALLDACYDRFAVADGWAAGDTVTMPVEDGETDALLTTWEPIAALLPLDYDPDRLVGEPVLEEPLAAPLAADQPVGVLQLLYGGAIVGETALYTAEAVAYVEPEPPAKANRPDGRLPSPLDDPWNRTAARY